jgi:AI-2 transport protein TqsA
LTLLVKALLVDVDPTARWAVALAGSLEQKPSPPRPYRHRRRARRGVPTADAANPDA